MLYDCSHRKVYNMPSNNPPKTPSASSSMSRKAKSNRSQIGGTAVPGAKSTQPKQIVTSNNPQEQEQASANRMMRRRMEHLGTGPRTAEQVKTVGEKRKERIRRIKERQKSQVEAVKKSLPGGKISTDTSRVLYLVGGVAVVIILLIVIFVVLRLTGH
jgi:cobalamin biosynthesis Mg chelatase CobN